MIGVKEAVKLAIGFVGDLYPPDQIKDVALEEVRRSDDEKNWLITVGFRALSGHTAVKSNSLFPTQPVVEKVPREYKEVIIDGETGEVRSMVIRSV